MELICLEQKKLEFYGGEWMSFSPIVIFVLLTIICSFVFQTYGSGAQWLPAFVAISVSMFFAKNKVHYATTVMNGFADKNAAVPIICWIYAGVFARVLRECGLAESFAKKATDFGISTLSFIIVTFISIAIFTMGIGSGMGTVAMGMGVFYPAGVAMGASAPILAGAILSGAALGDAMSLISDTTVCSCSIMGVSPHKCISTRWKYSLVSGSLTLIMILCMGNRCNSETSIVIEANEKALFMLIPMILTIVIAMKCGNIVVATTCGIIMSCAVAIGLGLIDFIHFGDAEFEKAAIFEINGSGNNRVLTGILYEGINGMLPNIILCLLLFGMIQVMHNGNGVNCLLNVLGHNIIRGQCSAEMVISVITILLSAMWGLNAPAILLVGASFGNSLSQTYRISPYRMSNIMAFHSVTLCYCAPWTAVMMLAVSLSSSSVKPLTAVEIASNMYYAYISIGIMLLSTILKIGQKDGIKK